MQSAGGSVGLARTARAVLMASMLIAPTAHAASTTALMRVTGGGATTSLGDYVTVGLNTTYRFYVEVPPGLGQLQIQIFDADFGAGAGDYTGDRDRPRNAFNSSTTYRLFQPDGTAITTGSTPALQFNTGNTTLPAGADNVWLSFYTRNNPPAGHWTIEVDSSASTGDDVNAFGLRAHDGTAGSGGTELNVYADSYVGIGVNAIDGASTRGTTFTLYPYITEGCNPNHMDFDWDSNNGILVGGIAQNATYTNRSGDYTITFANASLSVDDEWNTDNLANVGATAPSGSISDRDGLGIFTAAYRINEFTGDNSNYSTIFVGDDGNTTTPPTAQPQADTERIYLPTDAGVAPPMPYLRQTVFHASGPNPPQVGQNTFLNVTISVVNPLAQSITFSATNQVSARVPTGTANAVFVGGSTVVSQGTVTGTPANLGNGLVTWNVGTLPANTTAALSYQIRVTPSAAGQHNITGAGNGTTNANTHGTRMQFLDHTGNSSQARATYAFGGLCPLAITTTAAVPTPVTVSWMKVSRAGGALDVEWTTDTEYRNAGFDLFGRRDGSWTRLNGATIGADGDRLGARYYRVQVPADVTVDAVALEDIGADGRRERHPAVAVGTEKGRLHAGVAPTWASLSAEQQATSAALRAGRGVSTAAWLDVNRAGIQRVSAAALAAAGVDLGGTPVNELALSVNGQPVPRLIENAPGGVWGAGSAVVFHGRTRNSRYGKTQVYRLERNPVGVLPAQVVTGAGAAWAETLDWYAAEARLQRNQNYSFTSPTDDPWFDTRMLAFSGTPQISHYVLNVDAAVPVPEQQSVFVSLWGGSDWPAIDDDHRVRVLLDGAPVAVHAFPGFQDQLLRFTLPASALGTGAHTVSIELTADTGAAHDIVHIEAVGAGYARGFVLRDGTLDAVTGPRGEAGVDGDVLFRDGAGDTPLTCAYSRCAAVQVQGAGPSFEAYVVRDNALWRLDGLSADGAGAVRVVVPRAEGDRLVVTTPAAVATAGVRAAATVGNPASPGAQLLIVAHPNFAGGLGAFVAARSAEGLSVRVVSTDEAYARYTAGQPDPLAIQALLRDAYALGTRYALLVGGDTYDYDNNQGAGSISFLPTFYASTGAIVHHAPADTLFGDIDGDSVPEIAVGRWPVRSAAELDAVIAKTLAYATANHARSALLVSGSPEAGIDFGTWSSQIGAQLTAQSWSVDSVALPASPTPAQIATARNDLVGAVNAGRAFTHFVGHSSVDRWTFDPLLLSGDVGGLLGNATRPTVVAQWGCWASYFVSPSADSMGQRFLLSASGGAAAVVGVGTLVDNQAQEQFMAMVIDAAAGAGDRLGDAIDSARREYGATHPERRDLTLGVNLLGDPTLRLRR